MCLKQLFGTSWNDSLWSLNQNIPLSLESVQRLQWIFVLILWSCTSLLFVSQTKAELRMPNRQRHRIYQISVFISNSKADTTLTSMLISSYFIPTQTPTKSSRRHAHICKNNPFQSKNPTFIRALNTICMTLNAITNVV